MCGYWIKLGMLCPYPGDLPVRLDTRTHVCRHARVGVHPLLAISTLRTRGGQATSGHATIAAMLALIGEVSEGVTGVLAREQTLVVLFVWSALRGCTITLVIEQHFAWWFYFVLWLPMVCGCFIFTTIVNLLMIFF